ncbi:MAG: amidohydrolase family protein, partial [Ruminiclostridium sp.]|nr:amidohydrolase family protein [Ruminiclostridium sp.]
MTYDSPDAIRMFRFCGEKGLPVIVEVMYPYKNEGGKYPRPDWWYGGSMDAYERAIAACPETIFFGHGPGVWCHISGDDKYLTETYPEGEVLPGGKLIDMMYKYNNFYCDLSANSALNALKRDVKLSKQFILEFQDRMIYGRDNFSNGLQEFLNNLGLPEDVLEKIYYKNALRLVPLN